MKAPSIFKRTVLALVACASFAAPSLRAISQYGIYDQQVVAQDGDLSVQSGCIYYASNLTDTLVANNGLAGDFVIYFHLIGQSTYYNGYQDYSSQAAAACGDMSVDLIGGWWRPSTVEEPFVDIQSTFDSFIPASNDPSYLQGWNDAYNYVSYQNSLLIYYATWVEEVITMTL